MAKALEDSGWSLKFPVERDELFILFRNGNDFHWVLKYFDGNKKLVQNPNEIITTLLDGEIDNKGDTIDYKILMKHFRDLKSWLKNDITERLMVETVEHGRKTTDIKQERYIPEALQNMGDRGNY